MCKCLTAIVCDTKCLLSSKMKELHPDWFSLSECKIFSHLHESAFSSWSSRSILRRGSERTCNALETAQFIPLLSNLNQRELVKKLELFLSLLSGAYDWSKMLTDVGSNYGVIFILAGFGITILFLIMCLMKLVIHWLSRTETVLFELNERPQSSAEFDQRTLNEYLPW